MVWNLDASWLVMAVVVVGILSFILSLALNAIMGEDGFGPTGNAFIITAGFFLSVFVANHLGYRLTDLRSAIAVGMSGAFFCLTVLALAKALIGRLES